MTQGEVLSHGTRSNRCYSFPVNLDRRSLQSTSSQSLSEWTHVRQDRERYERAKPIEHTEAKSGILTILRQSERARASVTAEWRTYS
jgi:hypothetical protein